jgi:hypothetical protein
VWRDAGRRAGVRRVKPAFVLWTGVLRPATAYGVILNADGSGQQLATSDGKTVKVTGAFKPTGTRLATIRAAATRRLARRRSPRLPRSWTAATRRSGRRGRRDARGDRGQREVGEDRRADRRRQRRAARGPQAADFGRRRRAGGAALRIDAPAVADCPSNSATTITKEISLKDAAARASPS